VAGNFRVGLFSVLFIAFFFLKDGKKLSESFFLLIPERNHEVTERIITDSQNLLRRYFIGVILELIGVMSIITIGLWIFGVENALLIGFFGGIMNIIPYLGPVIGTAIGMTLGVTATLAAGNYAELMPTFFKLAGVFMAANFIDNNILVPYIYSTSVKAHPLEIFIVIIMAGSLAGIFGMLMAIPVYTVLRVIARELLFKFWGLRKISRQSDHIISN
jgi:predicted PurR-regulated permease PerM